MLALGLILLALAFVALLYIADRIQEQRRDEELEAIVRGPLYIADEAHGRPWLDDFEWDFPAR